MLVAAMHNKAWLAVGVNDKKRTELLLFSKKLEKACDTFWQKYRQQKCDNFWSKTFYADPKAPLQSQDAAASLYILLGSFAVVLKSRADPNSNEGD